MRNILLSVIGLTPQVLTETLYYYTVVSNPTIAFDEIRVITTETGKRAIIEKLLAPEHGQFHRFCRDYGVSGLRFDEATIHVIGRTKPLDDIRTVEDNGQMAAQILDIVRKLTEDPSTALYCSIAGGRKTMGAYLALALQLYGRPQDHLSHVLVTPAFETSPEFYYIPPESRTLSGRNAAGQEITLNTADARIDLADIPFISVREYLPEKGDFPLEELVRKLQASVEGPRSKTSIDLSLRKKKLWVGDAMVKLQPKELAIYAFFAAERKRCKKRACCGCTACSLSMNEIVSDEHADVIFSYYRKISGQTSGQYERALASWQKMPVDEKKRAFLEAFSKINTKLRRAVGELDYPLVELSAEGGYGEKRYGIRLDKKAIRIEE